MNSTNQDCVGIGEGQWSLRGIEFAEELPSTVPGFYWKSHPGVWKAVKSVIFALQKTRYLKKLCLSKTHLRKM